MHQRNNNRDQQKPSVCSFPSSKRICSDCPLEVEGHEVQQPRKCHKLDRGELEYDYLMTLASMYDDPTKDFDIKLEKQL